MYIVNIGSVAYDTIIQVHEFQEFKSDLHLWAKETYHAIGSTGAGKALCLASLGIDNSLITVIGKDEQGTKIKKYLSANTIDVHYYESDVSIAHTNIMHGSGNRISATTSYPSDELGINPLQYEHLIKKADIVLLNINDFARGFIPILKKHEKTCVVDLHDYDGKNEYHKEFLQAADIVFTSGVGIENQKAYIESHIECGKLLSVVTLGSEGYIAQDSSGKWHRGQIFDG